MTRTLTLLLTLGALALFAGCGGDDEPSPGGAATTQEETATEETTTEATTTEETTTESGEDSGGSVKIKMADIAFAPKEATAKVGQEVEWENEDSAPHNVISEAKGGPKSETFGKGESYKFTPQTAGEIAYVCTLHPGMEGTLTVTE